MPKEVTTTAPLRAFELWHRPDGQVKRQLCGGVQNDRFVCVPSLRIAYIHTCGSAKVVYNNTQLNKKKSIVQPDSTKHKE